MSSESYIVNEYFIQDDETDINIGRLRITNINVKPNNGIIRLSCPKNLLKMLPPLTNNCTYINLLENRLIKIEDIPRLLEYLNVSRNRIQQINFHNFTDNLQYLNINHNFIREIPFLPDGLETFICCNNKLDKLPEVLPSRLKTLKCCHNQIRELPEILPTILKVLACKNNNLNSIPPSIMNCNLLTNLKYDNNKYIHVREDILEFIDQVVRINRMNNTNRNNNNNRFNKYVKTVYRDGQNVHDRTIEGDVLESLKKIISKTKLKLKTVKECLLEFDKIVNEEDDITFVEDDEYIYSTPYKKLEYLCSIDYKHLSLDLTYGDIFIYIWNRIRTSPNRNDIIKILVSELDEMISVCFTGRISRLVNCLNGFDDIVVVGISELAQIQGKYDLINKKLLKDYDEDSLEYNIIFKYWFTDLLEEIKIDDNKIKDWTIPFNDYIEEYLTDCKFDIEKIREGVKGVRLDYRERFLNDLDMIKTDTIKNQGNVENSVEDESNNSSLSWFKGFLF